MRGFRNLANEHLVWRHSRFLRTWALTGRGELISGWRLGRHRALIDRTVDLAEAASYSLWIREAGPARGGTAVYHARLSIHLQEGRVRQERIRTADPSDLTQFEAVLLAFVPRQTPETRSALPHAAPAVSADLTHSPAARRQLPKWPFVLAGSILAAGIAVAVIWPINVPYFALSPGPVSDVTDYIEVDDPALETGDLFFLTVTLKEVNLLEWMAAWIDDEVDLSPRETIRPAGVTPEELRSQNLALMDLSKQNAVFVALTRLGYDVTLKGSGALVGGVIEGSAAEGVLMENDIIVRLGDLPIEFQDDLIDAVAGMGPGETIMLTIDRTGDDGAVQRIALDLTLGPFRSVDDDGNVIVDVDRGMIGVLLSTAPTEIEFPVRVVIDSQNIGGPSAGLMFTLEIINQLTPSDITNGHRIAGTGTIDQEGMVGPIGGVRQKVFAAIAAGADYVFVPGDNYPTAIEAAADDITVVKVENIDDALAFLDSLPMA